MIALINFFNVEEFFFNVGMVEIKFPNSIIYIREKPLKN